MLMVSVSYKEGRKGEFKLWRHRSSFNLIHMPRDDLLLADLATVGLGLSKIEKTHLGFSFRL